MSEVAAPETVTIEPSDVIWTYTPSEPEKYGPPREIFEKGMALAVLLAQEKLFIGKVREDNQFPEFVRGSIGLSVMCNDVFMWGCSDSEELKHDDLEELYRMHVKDPGWGTAVWVMKKRGMMPQEPVEKAIKKDGIWDLDSMGLEENFQTKYYREQREKKTKVELKP